MNVSETVEKARVAAGSLIAKNVGNEANTKALVIEPVLKALGWDTTDIDVVEREVLLYDGTFLDYSLKVDGVPRVYVEAKSLSGNLTDKKFVAQSVNYANNSGVIWCVLTNGRRYRVFKSNETAYMEDKLLFEVDLDDEQPIVSTMEQLRRISRDQVAAGKLDEYGERVFTDSRVRTALAALAADPPDQFLDLIAARIGIHAPPDAALRMSLARVLDAGVVPAGPAVAGSPASNELGALATPSSTDPAPTATVAKTSTGSHQPSVYGLDHHLAGKAVAMRELWESVDTALAALGGDIERRTAKITINYFRGKKAIGSAQISNKRVFLTLKLDPATTVLWNDDAMRDLTGLGHQGNGDVAFSLTGEHQLEQVAQLFAQAYSEAG